ncbi:MAG: ABC transporter permease [Bdellovibrionales bacterium]|nr:ABC transporter permease [Bdellovibrionales bacterium]
MSVVAMSNSVQEEAFCGEIGHKRSFLIDLLIGTPWRFYHFFATIYQYREYLKQSVARDLRKKYKRSTLGYLWSMLNPLFMIAVLTLIFTHLLPRVENYAVFLFCGLLAWQYFVSTVNESMGSIRGNMKLIEQVPLPRFLFPVSVAFSHFVNLLLSLVALGIVMFVVGHPMTLAVLYFPIICVPLFLLTVGFSLLFAVSEIFFEDTKHLSRVLLSAWYYLTPVLYPPEKLPEHVLQWLRFNPLFYPIFQTREIFYFGHAPTMWPFLYSCIMGIFILGVGLCIFYRSEDKFIYFA